MLIITMAVAATVFQTPAPALTCPVMGSPVTAGVASVDYAGVRYGFCCAGCDASFSKEPTKYLASEKNKGKALGLSLFDPVSRTRVDLKKAKGTADYAGVRYPFASEANRKAFEANPKAFTKAPAKESLNCPVTGGNVVGYAAAPAYADYDNVRYYFCCEGCIAPFGAEPAKFAPKAAEKAAEPKARPAPKTR